MGTAGIIQMLYLEIAGILTVVEAHTRALQGLGNHLDVLIEAGKLHQNQDAGI